MIIKTSELTGTTLDWAVAKCEGLHREDTVWSIWASTHQYSTDWTQGGPIIEREVICLLPHSNGGWIAKVARVATDYKHGQTPLTAAMRCYVASKLGDNVDIPNELLQGQL